MIAVRILAAIAAALATTGVSCVAVGLDAGPARIKPAGVKFVQIGPIPGLGPMHIPTCAASSTPFTQSLGSAGAIGLDGYSVRQVAPTTGSAANQIRAQFQVSAGTFVVAHASVGIQSSAQITTATPIELHFNQTSGFSTSTAQTVVSDWTSFAYSANATLVVVMDYTTTTGGMFQNGTGTYYRQAATSSYNQANPTGTWSGFSSVLTLTEIDVRSCI